MEVHEAAHLDRAAEGDLTVTLAEVQVAEGQIGTRDEDRVEDARTLGEVLDVLVATVLARRSRAGGLGGDTVELGTGERAQNSTFGLGRERQWRNALGIGGDQRCLTLVPLAQQLLGGSGAHQAGVDHAGELHVRHVA